MVLFAVIMRSTKTGNHFGTGSAALRYRWRTDALFATKHCFIHINRSVENFS